MLGEPWVSIAGPLHGRQASPERPTSVPGTPPGAGQAHTSDMEGHGAEHEPGHVPTNLRVPDDASALEGDRQAWLAEMRAARRRARARRLIFTRRWERFGLSGPIVTLCLLATALVGAVAVVFIPGLPTRSTPADLALVGAMPIPSTIDPSPPVVEPSGPRLRHVLPAVVLQTRKAQVAATALRPALIAVLPAECDCDAVLGTLVAEARAFQLQAWIIGVGSRQGQRGRLEALDAAIGPGEASWAADSTGGLSRAVAAHGLTLVLVRDDGVVTAIRRDVPFDPSDLPRLEPQLAVLDRPDRS